MKTNQTDKATAVSPLPWTLSGNGIECAGHYRVGSVNSIGTREGIANAALIVQAVNEHAALVAVAEAAAIAEKNRWSHSKAAIATFQTLADALSQLAAVRGESEGGK